MLSANLEENIKESGISRISSVYSWSKPVVVYNTN